ncbi:MAG: SusC/RagA family TonB-linked outer membrane protein, partial [Bacteroidota bacterium]
VQNFDGLINTGDIDGQGLTGAFAQRIAEGQPLYAYFLRQFGGFDAEGNSIYPNGDFQEFNGTSPLPTTTGGITNTFRIGNLDFSFFFSGQFGHHIYSNTRNAFFTAGSLANGRNVTTDVPGNGEGNLNAPDVSTRFLEKGDFIRLQNATLGYNFNVGNTVFSNLRLYLSGQNLFVITDYSGQDPEVSISKPINGVPSIGIDYTAYPRARTITLGANVSF